MSDVSKGASFTFREKSRILMFDVEGLAIAKPRMTQKDKIEPSAAARRYWSWKSIILAEFKQATLGAFTRFDGPVKLTCYFQLPIPPSWSKKRQTAALQRLELPTGKPDYKNLVAGIEDALNGHAWVDDSQVIGFGEGFKYYSREPGAAIIIEELIPPLILPWDTEASM